MDREIPRYARDDSVIVGYLGEGRSGQGFGRVYQKASKLSNSIINLYH